MKKVYGIRNFYIFVFIFWYGTEIIFNSTLINILGESFNKINNGINWFVFGLLMVQIVFFQSYTIKEIFIIVGITFPVIVATVLSGQKTIMSTWMFIVAAKNVNLDKVICVAYKILLITISSIIFMCLLGFIENKTLMRGDIERLSLGFSHPNQLGLRVFQLIVCYCYTQKNKLGKLNYVYIFLTILFLVKIPNSKTAYIVTAVLFLMLLMYEFMSGQKQKYMKLYENGILLGILFLNIFSIFFSYIDVNRNSVLLRIDRWMSSRFSLCHKVWLLYGVPFWGQKIYVTEDEIGLAGIKNRIWLDNAYVSTLLRYGVLIFLIFSISYLCLVRAVLLEKQYMLAIILFLYALYGIMENGLYMITHNIFLIAFASLLYKKPLENNEKYVKDFNKGES